MDIDLTAPVKSTKNIMIDAPQHIVWDLITDVNQWPKHFGHVSSAHMVGDFVPDNTFIWKSGGIKITSTIHQAKPQSFIVWTGKAIGTQAVHIWRLTSQEKGSCLETSESLNGWLIKMMPNSMQRTLDKTLDAWLQSIKKVAENVASI